MIITRSPLRVSLVGGGSDLESHYKIHGGKVVSFAINKYVYCSLNSKFLKGIRLAYSEIEHVEHFYELRHKIARETLGLMLPEGNLEIATIADVPSKGTGLASSSAFTASLVLGLSKFKSLTISRKELAELVCEIEITKVQSPIGKQDQYATVYGGMNNIIFEKNGKVIVNKLSMSIEQLNSFEDHLLLVHTGINRETNSSIFQLASSDISFKNRLLSEMSQLCDDVIRTISNQDFKRLGEILTHTWEMKKQLSRNMSNDLIDGAIYRGLKSGAYGGKLLGAGNGGFILFICPPVKRNRVLRELNMPSLNAIIDHRGSSIIYSED
jgi:D-glycero-alpha-D-manno-heptose-7-phosphate kinase